MQSPILRCVYTCLCMAFCILYSLCGYGYTGVGPELEPTAEPTKLLQTINCPSSITVTCADLGIYMTYAEFQAAGGDVDVPSECTVEPNIVWDGDTETAVMGCLTIYSRAYVVMTDCGDFGCSQTVLLSDNAGPTIDFCLTDTIVTPNNSDCTATVALPATLASDDCGMATVTDDAPATFPVGNTTVTYTATDDCGNTSTCTTTVTVMDNGSVSLDCSSLADTEQCPNSGSLTTISAFTDAGGVVTNPCGADLTDFELTSTENEVPGGTCDTIATVTRTYTITNNITGATASCEHVFSLIDTIAPTFIVPANAENVACELRNDTTITGVPTMIEDCTATTTTYSDDLNITGGLCSEGTIERTWYVADACGNVDSLTQMITFIDTVAPTVVCQDVTVYIPIGGSTTVSASAYVASQSDNCSSVSIFYAPGSSGVVQCNDASASPKTIKVLVDDACGNVADTCISTLMILDTIAPVLSFVENDTVYNMADIPAEYTTIGEFMVDPNADVADNCAARLNIAVQADTVTGCPTVITREYILTQPITPLADTATQTIVIIDTIAPVVTCPADIVISETDICDTLISIEVEFDEAPVTVTTSVGAGVFTSSTTYEIEEYFTGGSTDVQFIVTDQCDNADTCTVNVQLATAPVFTCPPSMVTYSATILPDYPTIDSFFNAGGQINMFCDVDSMSFAHDAVFEVDPNNDCNATVTETFAISNMDGTRTFTEVKTTDVEDNERPVLDCSGLLPVLASLEAVLIGPNTYDCVITYDNPLVMPTATDNFGGTVTITSGEPSMNLGIGEFYWYAEDACGNRDTCTLIYNLNDVDSPNSNDALDTMAVCSSELPAVYPDGAAGIDALLMDHEEAFIFDCKLDSSSFGLLSADTLANGDIVRQYEVSDSTGSNDIITQTLTITDSEPPSPIVGCTDTTTTIMGAACELDMTLTAIYAFDNCSADSTTNTYTNNLGFANGTSHTFPIGMTDVIWTITDANGNDTTCTQTVTVLDGEDPTITAPSPITVACSISNLEDDASYSIQDLIADGGTVSDNCGLDSTTFTVQTVLVGGTCPQVYTRTFSIMDNSGRSTSFDQSIEVNDEEPPIVTPAFDVVIQSASDSLCGIKIELTAPTANDACGVESLVAVGMPADSFFAVGLDTVQWIATDSCGLMDTAMVLIQVDDVTSPNVITPVDTSYYDCDTSEVDILLTPAMVAALNGDIYDACGYDIVYLSSVVSSDGDTLIRNYNAVDPSNNFEPFSHVIINDDGLGIDFDAPADTVLQCPITAMDIVPEQLGDIRDSTFRNACDMEADTIYFTDSELPDLSPCTQSYTIERVWTVEDSMGIITSETQLISVVDTVAPVFDNVPAIIADISCHDTKPMQEVLTATDGCDSDPIVTTAVLFDEDVCAGYEVTHRWYTADACGNIDSVETTYQVLPDTESPVPVTASSITVPVTDGCELDVADLPVPEFIDSCSAVTSVVPATALPPLTAGKIHWVTWLASDACGNDTMWQQGVEVIDTIPPSVICKSGVTVGINNDSVVTLPATSFYKDPADNCGIDRVEVRRMTAVCGADTDEFGDFATFCCADVGQTVNVVVRAIDIYGNESVECMATATVTDKLAPSIVEYLLPVTVSCEYPLDVNDLSAFGTYVFRESDRDSVIGDATITTPDGYVGLDGLLNEQCGGTVTELEPVVSLSTCAQGTITRRFEVADLQGNSVILSQTITVVDIDKFTINRNDDNDPSDDVIWPGTYTWDQCMNPAPDTSISGAPIILNDDKCSQVAANYKDLVFQIGNGGCAFIERTWTVIDWCQYDASSSPNPGKWTYAQEIYVDNVTAPTFDQAEVDTVICAPNTACVGMVGLSRSGADDCTADSQLGWSYTVDYDLDGNTNLTGSTNTFNRIVSRGTHSITWTLSDLCGNTATITDTFTVKECKAPTPVCYSGLSAALDNNDSYELWASDVNNNSFDNCTSRPDLLLSFSSDVTDDVRIFDESHIGPNTVELWVTDEDGNQSFCTSIITIQQNQLTTPATVMGRVVTAQGAAIADSKVALQGAELVDYEMSDIAGGYAFMTIETESEVEVSVSKEGNAIDGVNTLDIVKIQRHILGVESFDSPYQTLAADANDDERVTAADLLALRKLVLGVYTELPDNKVWRFVNASDVNMDVNDPWPYTEEMAVTAGAYVTDGDFVGIKVGDVDHTMDALMTNDIDQRSTKYYGLVSQQQRYEVGQIVHMPLTAGKDLDLQALQLTISYDHKSLRLLSVSGESLELRDDQINTVEGAATLSWNELENLATSSGETLLSVQFEALRAGDLQTAVDVTSAITRAVAYDSEDEEYKVSLDYIDNTRYDIAMHQNRPNPFFHETVVEFDLPEEMEIGFTIFDASGRIHWNTDGVYPAGQNSLLVSEELAGKRGVFYLKMAAAEFSQVIKMIKIE